MDDFATQLVSWMNAQPDITDAKVVDSQLGQVFIGFRLGGVPTSLMANYTE